MVGSIPTNSPELKQIINVEVVPDTYLGYCVMMTKEQIKNAKSALKGVNSNIKKIDATYGSLSYLLRELRNDTDLSGEAFVVCDKLGLNYRDLTPAMIKSVLRPEQFLPTKIGKETVNCMCTYKESQVYDEVEATLPDGSKKKVKMAKVENGAKVTEVRPYAIKPGKWSANSLFTLLSQARELSK